MPGFTRSREGEGSCEALRPLFVDKQYVRLVAVDAANLERPTSLLEYKGILQNSLEKPTIARQPLRARFRADKRSPGLRNVFL